MQSLPVSLKTKMNQNNSSVTFECDRTTETVLPRYSVSPDTQQDHCETCMEIFFSKHGQFMFTFIAAVRYDGTCYSGRGDRKAD